LPKRVVLSAPSHPLALLFYLLLLLPAFASAPSVFGSLLSGLLPPREAAALGSALFALSLLASPVNVVLKEVATGEQAVVLEARYVYFFGIPVPVFSTRLVEKKVLFAVNVGGCAIPVALSALVLSSSPPAVAAKALLASAAVALVVFATSRSVPGAGILSPAFVPPLLSALFAFAFSPRSPAEAFAIAYASGTLGALLGADVLRLAKDFRALASAGPGMLSVGGAGVFDGVFLSGLLACLLLPAFYFF